MIFYNKRENSFIGNKLSTITRGGILGFKLIALCIILSSCESSQEKYERMKKEREAIAHRYNCITLDEFCNMNYSYIYENNLPCLVYLERFHVYDIVSYYDLPDHIIKEYDDSYDAPSVVKIYYNWYGKPSRRDNECWMKVCASDRRFQYIGLNKTQANWVLSKTRNTKSVDTPIIIKLYQVGFENNTYASHSGYNMSYTADLIEVLDNE